MLPCPHPPPFASWPNPDCTPQPIHQGKAKGTPLQPDPSSWSGIWGKGRLQGWRGLAPTPTRWCPAGQPWTDSHLYWTPEPLAVVLRDSDCAKNQEFGMRVSKR